MNWEKPLLWCNISKVLTEENKVEIWGSGEEKRNLLYVDDLCRMVELVKKNKNKFELYNCGSNDAYSVEEVVRKMIQASNKDLKIVNDLSKPTIKTNIHINSDKQRMNWAGSQRQILKMEYKEQSIGGRKILILLHLHKNQANEFLQVQKRTGYGWDWNDR